MDYEKKYKEALETARKINSGEGVAGPPDWTTYEVIFPELKESEDERVRKSIIHLVKKSQEQGGYALHKDEADKMLIWLEEQGERKPKWTNEDEELYQDALDAFEAISNDLILLVNWRKLYDWLKSIKQRMEEQQ